jgi:hypothetical protein
MRHRCPVCRAPISDSEICLTCGAWFSEGPAGYRGRPTYVFLGRWLVVVDWMLILATAAAAAALPNIPGPAGALQGSLGLPLSALTVIAGVRAAISGVSLLGLANILFGILFLTVLATASPMASWEGWWIVGAAAFYCVVTLPFVVRMWRHPLPVFDMLSCQQCGYSLRGLAVPRCPECGTRFDPGKLRRLSLGAPPGKDVRPPNP